MTQYNNMIVQKTPEVATKILYDFVDVSKNQKSLDKDLQEQEETKKQNNKISKLETEIEELKKAIINLTNAKDTVEKPDEPKIPQNDSKKEEINETKA